MSCSMTKDTFDNCARHEIESIDVMPTNTRTPFEELNIRPCVGMEFVSIEKVRKFYTSFAKCCVFCGLF